MVFWKNGLQTFGQKGIERKISNSKKLRSFEAIFWVSWILFMNDDLLIAVCLSIKDI